jgi:hypothetical protein
MGVEKVEGEDLSSVSIMIHLWLNRLPRTPEISREAAKPRRESMNRE